MDKIFTHSCVRRFTDAELVAEIAAHKAGRLATGFFAPLCEDCDGQLSYKVVLKCPEDEVPADWTEVVNIEESLPEEVAAQLAEKIAGVLNKAYQKVAK